MNLTDFIKEETAGSKMFVTVRISGDIDETAFKTMAFSSPTFVPAVLRSDENGENILNYDVTADRFIKLSLFNSTELTPANFVTLMKNLTDIFTKCDDYFMNPLNFIIHEDYIYVKSQTFDVRLVYVPFDEPKYSEAEICDNIFKMVRKIIRASSEWSLIGTHLFAMTGESSIYKVAEAFGRLYEEYLGSNSGARQSQSPPSYSRPAQQPQENNFGQGNEQKPVVENAHVAAPAFTPASAANDKKEIKEEPKKSWWGSSKNDKDDKKKEEPPAKSGGGRFSGSKPNEPAPVSKPPVANIKPEEPPKPSQSAAPIFKAPDNFANESSRQAPSPISGGDFDQTQLSAGAGFAQAVSARLDYCGKPGKRLPEVIRIEPRNGSFSIGRIAKGRSDCDYAFPEGTEGVSRMHAQIKESNGKYFIYDMNSSYGTYVESGKIPPQQAVELTDGCKVSFSTEVVYEFRIEKPK